MAGLSSSNSRAVLDKDSVVSVPLDSSNSRKVLAEMETLVSSNKSLVVSAVFTVKY